jgi:hypothetical protein
MTGAAALRLAPGSPRSAWSCSLVPSSAADAIGKGGRRLLGTTAALPVGAVAAALTHDRPALEISQGEAVNFWTSEAIACDQSVSSCGDTHRIHRTGQ